MKQKLAVARAVFHRPSLVFLDEPTAGLDPVASAALRDDLAALAASEGVTIFLTTHNLAEAERLCALVGVIRNGRLAALGAPGSLGGDGDVPVVVTGTGWTEGALQAARLAAGVREAVLDGDRLAARLEPGAPNAALVEALVRHGVAIDEVRRETLSLERAFLDLVTEDTGAR